MCGGQHSLLCLLQSCIHRPDPNLTEVDEKTSTDTGSLNAAECITSTKISFPD